MKIEEKTLKNIEKLGLLGSIRTLLYVKLLPRGHMLRSSRTWRLRSLGSSTARPLEDVRGIFAEFVARMLAEMGLKRHFQGFISMRIESAKTEDLAQGDEILINLWTCG